MSTSVRRVPILGSSFVAGSDRLSPPRRRRVGASRHPSQREGFDVGEMTVAGVQVLVVNESEFVVGVVDVSLDEFQSPST